MINLDEVEARAKASQENWRACQLEDNLAKCPPYNDNDPAKVRAFYDTAEEDVISLCCELRAARQALFDIVQYLPRGRDLDAVKASAWNCSVDALRLIDESIDQWAMIREGHLK